MSLFIQQVFASIAATVGAAVILAIGNWLRKTSRSVRETSESTTKLVASVAELQASDRETRERLAVLWDREHWPVTSDQYPNRRNGTL